VRDYYNYAVQESVALLFQQRMPDIEANGGLTEEQIRLGDWTLRTDYNDVRLPEGVSAPKELIRASTLTFKGLRSSYRRDGFGAELVAVLGEDPIVSYDHEQQGLPNTQMRSRLFGDRDQPFSEMPSPTFTALLHFEGAVLDQVLSTRNVRLSVHDPYSTTRILIKGQTIPLAANFTAGYGLWLARTDFATQSLLTLFGRDAGINKPHIYLMQPYDPNRRILLMLHGLGSSPEAWVNVANEVMGDEGLRNEFQVWQVYYPTNIPISFNHAVIRKAVQDTLRFFDPSGKARASENMVVIGHSMGGVISRLMVSESGDVLLRALLEDLGADPDVDQGKLKALETRLKPLVQFEPIPNISRAVFIAAPHRGTEFAGNRIGRWISSFIKLPMTLLEGFEDVLMTIGRADPKQPDGKLRRIPNSIDNLDQSDPFIKAAARLPISPKVPYHSIIAKLKPEVPLAQSNDGVVPYPSAHLEGAQSEKVILSGHSVQETAAAVLEVRRILHEDVRHYEQESD
jgi:pimeloyl-ACP methyl ester carboxylesterase